MTTSTRRALMAVSVCLPLVSFAARADTLDTIRAKGELACAVSDDQDDFSLFDTHGNVSAFSSDLCRAVAAAIFPSNPKVRIIATGDEITAVRAVRDHKADIAFGTTPDPAIGAQLSMSYAPPFLIDAQGFLVNSGENIHNVQGLAGKTICFVEGSPEGETLQTAMAERGIAFTPFPFSERGEMMGALATGHCSAVTGDVTELAAERVSLPALEQHGVILPDRITIDTWSPVLRTDEGRLLTIVAAVEDGLVSATVHGIGQQDVAADAAKSNDPVVARLLGTSTWEAKGLGLDERFLFRAIKAVGDQAELYQRDIGSGSAMKLPAGPNTPIEQGGALLSIPVTGAH